MRLKQMPQRGITTVDDLKARSITDPTTHCWIWQGATSNGKAAMWAFDHVRGERRVMPGALAAWNIAYGAAPRPGWLVFAGCGNRLCVNPVHQRQARDRAEHGRYQARAGWLCGKALEQKAQALKKARAARGVVETPKHIVEQVRAMPGLPGAEVARRLGINKGRVYDIRAGRTHKLPASIAPALEGAAT